MDDEDENLTKKIREYASLWQAHMPAKENAEKLRKELSTKLHSLFEPEFEKLKNSVSERYYLPGFQIGTDEGRFRIEIVNPSVRLPNGETARLSDYCAAHKDQRELKRLVDVATGDFQARYDLHVILLFTEYV